MYAHSNSDSCFNETTYDNRTKPMSSGAMMCSVCCNDADIKTCLTIINKIECTQQFWYAIKQID